MARCKSSPEVVRTKCELANRLKDIRVEQYGERGGPELARRLSLPIRTWYNYETGVTVPSEVLLRFIELTEVEPKWLLHGQGPKFRRNRVPVLHDDMPAAPGSVPDLLRQALSMLESGGDFAGHQDVILPDSYGLDPQMDQVVVRIEDPDRDINFEADEHSQFETMPLKREWLNGAKHFRCIRVRDEAMAPILTDGAVVGIAERPESPEALGGSLVAARVEGRMVIRWLQVAGSMVLLRAEDSSFEPDVVPIGSTSDTSEAVNFRRVLWIYTPHATPALP